MLKSVLPHGAGTSSGAAHSGSFVSWLNSGSEQFPATAQERAQALPTVRVPFLSWITLKSVLPHGAGKSSGGAHSGSSFSWLNSGSEQFPATAQKRAGKALQMLLHREGAGLHAGHGLLFVLEVLRRA